MLKNAYLLAKIGADTAENERNFAEILPKNLANFARFAYFYPAAMDAPQPLVERAEAPAARAEALADLRERARLPPAPPTTGNSRLLPEIGVISIIAIIQ